MPPKRSNKTARVLNLIAKSDNEPSDLEANAQEIINSNNNMSEDAIADLLQKHNDEQNKENEKASNADSNAVLSDDAITALFSQNADTTSEKEEAEISKELPPAPQPVVPILQNVREQELQLEEQICSELLSSLEDEIPPTTKQSEPSSEPEPEPNADSNAVLSDDAIAALFNQNSEQAQISAEPEPNTDSNAVLSDDAIAALFNQNNEQAQNSAEPEPNADSNAVLSDDAIAALFNQNNEQAQNSAEPEPNADSNAVLSDDAIAALFNQNNSSEQTPNNPQSVENTVIKDNKNDDYFGAAPHGKRSVKYVNVLQELVEEEAEYSSQMLKCNCPRCLADMKALTLTNLPSKYVVIEEGEKNGFLRIYASKYSRLISVQMMRACVIVNENPHH